jgi:hypothetical protein
LSIESELNQPSAAVEKAPDADYQPMKTAQDLNPEPKKKEYGDDFESVQRAAKDLTKAREEGRAPQAEAEIPREYRLNSGLGAPVPLNQTITAERAADDLTRLRAEEVASQQPNPADVAYAIDNFRAQVDQLQQPQQPAPEQSQPTVEPPQDGIDPEIAQALSNPKVRSAIEAELQQTTAERQQYAAAAKDAVTLAMAGVVANFPELGNIPIPHLKSAIDVIAQTNPQRAQAINAALERTEILMKVSREAQAAQQKIQAQKFQQFAQAEDAKFEAAVANENPETVRRVKDAAVEVFKEYGVSQDQLQDLWQSEPLMRTAPFQKMVFDLIRFKTAAANVPTKVAAKPVVPVQKPGVSRPSDNSEDVTAAMRRFNANPSPKNAADVLLARRANRR